MYTGVIWDGDPIFYQRSRGGHGLVVRDLHYLFDASGRIESVGKINAKVLEKIVRTVFKDSKQDLDMLLLAHMHTVGRYKARLETRKRTSATPKSRGTS